MRIEVPIAFLTPLLVEKGFAPLFSSDDIWNVMSESLPLEITITHNLSAASTLTLAEVAELFRRRLIALDWGRKDSEDPAAYTGRGKTDVLLFHRMRQQ